ncbi:MAG: FAD-dependent oxidoreductase [Steroidobacteraceae bacterium]
MGLTRNRDLRDGKAIWAHYPAPAVRGTRLQRSVSADVVVIGAGISGAMIAQSLAATGMRTLIVDRRRQAILGSTAASTALLQFELDSPLVKMRAAIGPRRAERVWIASREAVNELRTRTHRLGINADLQNRPSLYLCGNVLDAKGLKREAVARQRIGLPSEYLDRPTLRHHFGIDRDAALLSHGNAEANPVALTAGYLRQALRDGARFHAPHEVIGIESGRQGTTLLTDDGLELQARHVVMCTGYELAKIVPPNGSKVRSTWALATRPQPAALWPQRALIWEASDPYLYMRTTPDGRVICGGEDESFAAEDKRNALTPAKTKRLEKKLHRMFPLLDSSASVAWTGSFADSENGMPTIGAVPGFPRCHAVMGYGGNGITFSMLATQVITAAILGRKQLAAASLFRFP